MREESREGSDIGKDDITTRRIWREVTKGDEASQEYQ